VLKVRLNMKKNRVSNGEAGRDMVRNYRAGLYLCAALMLTACSSGGVGDLESFVAKIKAENPGVVEPLPELKPFEKFIYVAYLDEIRDPFITWETINPKADRSKKTSEMGDGLFPDGARVRDTLESYPLETLMMMGTLEYASESWGLIKAPDGIIYRVKRGNYIGQNHGKIFKVGSDNIELIEIISDGLGGWKNRPAELSLNDE